MQAGDRPRSWEGGAMTETYTHTTWQVKPGMEDEFVRRWESGRSGATAKASAGTRGSCATSRVRGRISASVPGQASRLSEAGARWPDTTSALLVYAKLSRASSRGRSSSWPSGERESFDCDAGSGHAQPLPQSRPACRLLRETRHARPRQPRSILTEMDQQNGLLHDHLNPRSYRVRAAQTSQ